MSAPLCCGHKCVTPYCPSCGKLVNQPHPLFGLLAHCRSMCKVKAKEVADCEKFNDGRLLERATVIYEKWYTWTKALEKLLIWKDE